MTDAIVVVLAELGASFTGEPSPLALPFGRSATLAHATVERIVRARVAPVVVCYRDTPANQPLVAMVGGTDTLLLPSPMGTNDAAMVKAALAATNARDAVVIDARWPFVHAALVRAQLARHREAGSELTFAALAAEGLAGVVVRRDAADRLASALAKELPLGFDLALIDFCEQVRAVFDTADTPVPEALVCMPAQLRCTTAPDVARLAPFALGPDDHDDHAYERAFDAECRAAWHPRAHRDRPRDRPKILFSAYTTSAEPGSVVAFRILLERMDRERHDLVLALPNRGRLHEYFDGELVSRTPLPVRWFTSLGDGRWQSDVLVCTRLLAEEQPDLVYVNGTVGPMAVACRAAGIPCIAHLHIPILKLGPRVSSRLARQACVPLYDAIIAPARTAAKQIAAAFRAPAGRITTVECGISTARFDPAAHDRTAARARLGLPATAPIVSVVGMLIALKQPELAVQAIAQLVQELPEVVLLFAGTERVLTGYQQRLEKLAAELGIGGRVRFLGHVDHITDVYAASDVLLHCAVGDTFPLVILEAMAMERPVVALADGGACESVQDGVTGRLIAMPGTPDAFAAALREILRSPELAAQMGQGGRARVIEHYDAERYAKRIARICDRVIAGAPLE